MEKTGMLAFDLGSSHGRAYWGSYRDGHLSLEALHDFPNGPTRVHGHWYWNVLSIFEEMGKGLRLAAERSAGNPFSIGIDTWGVDYALVDASGEMMAPMHHYRDPRTTGGYDRIHARIDPYGLYRETGIMTLPINSLVQLSVDQQRRPGLLDAAHHMLFAPDLFSYLLTGKTTNEITIASTSQLLDPARRAWSTSVIDAMGLPHRLFGPLIEPGRTIGPLADDVRRAQRLSGVATVVAVGGHDTASALAATPFEGTEGNAFISAGTWSLLGCERSAPIRTQASYRHNYTNECGVGGTTVYHKILAGLWLLQECRRCWAVGGETPSYADLHEAARAAPAFAAIFDPDSPSLTAPDDMPAAIAAASHPLEGRTIPRHPGAIVRMIYENLALNYRQAVDILESLTGEDIRTVHIVGGGSRAELLCRFTAAATGRRVVAGPAEATAIGNCLVQLAARGDSPSLSAGRDIVRASFPVTIYEPELQAGWQRAYDAFQALKAGDHNRA